MTIARKLWLGYGVLILILLVADITILLSAATMNRDLTQIVAVEERARTAAYEMEINTVEIGRDVRVYSLGGDPRYRENFAEDRAQFEESKARYDEVVDTRRGKELGESLMDKKDQQGTVSTGEQEEFLRRENELGSFLSQEVQPWATQQLAQAEDDANAAVRNVYVAIVSLILVGLIVGILAATLIYRGIIGSVRALTEGANRIGHGEMDHRIDVDASDELGAVASAFNDMLDRRREANAALNESEERFRRLSDATFEGVVMSENARIVDANRAFAEMFGYDLPEVVGLSVSELIAPESLELVLHNILSNAQETYEAVALRKDGSEFPLELSLGEMRQEVDVLFTGIVRDITGRKQAEEEARLAGIEVHLTKPVRQSELYDALATIMSATDEAASPCEAQLVTRHSLRERRAVSRSTGAPGMAAICAELQDVGASGYLGVAAELLGRLEKEFGRVRPALEAEAARDS